LAPIAGHLNPFQAKGIIDAKVTGGYFGPQMQTALWGITGIVVPFFVILGVMLMQTIPLTQIELSMARFCFVASGFLLEGAIVVSAFATQLSIWVKLAFAAVPSAGILGLLYCLDNWARRRVERQRGDLLFTRLNFDYDRDTKQLSARLMFFNDDSITRFVISVGFIYRSNRTQQGFEVFSTGTETDLFLGHVDPVRIAPNTPEIRQYSAKVANDKLSVIGAQAGVLITFSLPGRGYTSATVVLLEVMPSNLTLPSFQLPDIADLSLDSISEATRIASIIADHRAATQPTGFFAKSRTMFWRVLRLDH
jgi:hypothetical protein